MTRNYIARPEKAALTPNTMLNRIILALSRRPAPREHTALSGDTVREVVKAHSHGNVRLQWGQYYTRGDVDARAERLRGVRFTG
jgi:hypothetical protein